MAGNGVSVKIAGIDEMKRSLTALPQTLRKKVLLKVMRNAMKVALKVARDVVPVLAESTPYRKPGTVKKALMVRASKASRAAGNVGVFLNVKPAAGAKFKTVAGVKTLKRASRRGAKSQFDPYYWRWLEFGTRKMSKRPFLTTAGGKLPEVLAAFEREVIPAIQALNKPGA
jgi:HK97 gp10 family phage protein